MINSPEEGLGIYRRQLENFKQFVQDGMFVPANERTNSASWFQVEYRRLGERLTAMEEALKLTGDEAAAVQTEVGDVPPWKFLCF